MPKKLLDRAPVYTDRAFWIRQAYMHLFQLGLISAVIRLKDRSDPGHQNFIPAGVPLPVRFISKPAAPLPGGRGNLLPDDGTTFERTEVIVKTIGELTDEDFVGMAPDTQTQEMVQYHLATVNDIPLPPLDTVVTIWRFKLLPKVEAEDEVETETATESTGPADGTTSTTTST